MSDYRAHFVDETACRRFETDWLSGRRQPIEHYLPTEAEPRFLPTLEELVHIELELAWKRAACPQASSAELASTLDAPPRVEAYLERFWQLRREDVLLRLVQQEYAVRRRGGELPDLNEYRRRFPQLALSEDAFETRQLSHVHETAFEGQHAPANSEADLLASGQRSFGNYELLEQIGRGGMGVVYRARQRGAERDVALKVIALSSIDALTAGQRQCITERFRIEAIAAARLEHENIVTVHDVGAVEGLPYYAMRLVNGVSLAEMTRIVPLDNHRAATYLEAVARAVHAAHQRGILHRDLKPQNILVDAQTDRPLVADFGLAKFVTCAETITRSGELVGTPSYMAPEQIDDAPSAGPDSDVYSLGATLYHLLTGRPPFQAAALTDTLWQVKCQEPVTPRHLNPAVAKDLETICLKCLQKDRSRRYRSAESLAEDLGRCLRGEPILARPIGPVERMLRWRRRNRIAARWLLAAAAMLLATIVAGMAGYLSTAAALAKHRQSFQRARQAVDDLHIAVSEDDLLNQPGMQPLRQKLLRRAAAYYRQFITERSNDPAIARNLAGAYYRLGKITEELESPERAMPYYDRAREAQESLDLESPHDLALQEALGDTLNSLGAALCKLERLDESAAAFHKAASIREKLVSQNPNRAEWQRKLANLYMNLGTVEAARGDFAAARRQAETANAMRERLLKQSPADVRLLNDSGKGRYNLAKIALAEGRVGAAEAELRSAIQAFLTRSQMRPDDLDTRSRLGACYRFLGQVLNGAGDSAEKSLDARAAYQLARETIEALAHANPHVGAYQAELAAIRLELAGLDRSAGRLHEALQGFDAARRILEPLAPQEPRLRRDFAVALRELALLQLAENNLPTAREDLARSLGELQELVNGFPENAKYREDYGQTERLIAWMNEQLSAESAQASR